MKAARVVMFLSPLLYFMPPLISYDSLGMSLVGFFFSRLLAFFPWNLVVAAIAWTFAKHRGRDAFWWMVGALWFPFIVPFVLAFMPEKPGAASAELRRAAAKSGTPAKGAVGTFEERFPLLQTALAGQPEEVWSAQRTQFTPVGANFEFLLLVNPAAVTRIVDEADRRRFTLWATKDEAGPRLYGAGFIKIDHMDETVAWLKGVTAPGRKITTAVRYPDGMLQITEHRVEDAAAAGATGK